MNEKIKRFYSATVTTVSTETAQMITTDVTQQINTKNKNPTNVQQIKQVETKLEGGLKTPQDSITTCVQQSPTPILAPEITQQITVLTKALFAATSCLDQKLTPSDCCSQRH